MAKIRITQESFPISPNPASGKNYIGFDSGTGLLNTQNSAGTVTAYSAVPTLAEELSGFIEAATAKTYTLDLACAFAGTINTLNIKTVSGTCTVALKINGVDVTSISAVSVSSVLSTATASGANTLAAGNTITLVVSSVSTPVDMAFTLKITRT